MVLRMSVLAPLASKAAAIPNQSCTEGELSISPRFAAYISGV